ncbi:MAG: alpha/beta fold hydrolase [Pseudonocardiaceae bacterium]
MSNHDVNHMLEVPGARLHYQVKGSGPVLLMPPMDAGGYRALAAALAEQYTVITYDPRGFGMSTVADPEQDLTPELAADDARRVLSAVTSGPADVFGSSGGAVTGLALVSDQPGRVRTLIAHEPPVVELLADHAEVQAALDGVTDTYRDEGAQAAYSRFFSVIGLAPPPGAMTMPETRLPDPAWVFLHCIPPTTRYHPDIATLRAAPTRIVIGRGETSPGQLNHRTATALAQQLGIQPVEFPGDHIGFATNPAQFAAVLRRVLQETPEQR